jgi:hypothetical protein
MTMTLQLISDTPVFHRLALDTIQEELSDQFSAFLKQRMRDLHVGDPHAPAPHLAIEASATLETYVDSEGEEVEVIEVHEIPESEAVTMKIDLRARAK